MQSRKSTTSSLPIPALLAALLVLSSCATSTRSVAPPEADSSSVKSIHTFRLEYANVHVVESQAGGLTLIDAGYERHTADLEEAMREEGLDPTKIEAVIVTHGHDDHSGGAPYFRERYGAKVIVGEADRAMLAEGKNAHICPTGFFGKRLEASVRAERYTPYEADLWIPTTATTPLDTISPGLRGEVVPMAGHTPGHLIVVMGEVAFVGDLFRGSIVGSSAETHFFMCDLEDNRHDIESLLKDYPDIKTYFTGHFGSVSREAVTTWLDETR